MQDLERVLRHETGAVASVSPVRSCAPRTARSATASRSRSSFPRARRPARSCIFLRFNSPPGALTSIVTNDGRAATVTAIYPDHKGETIRQAVEVAEEFIAENPMGTIRSGSTRTRAAPGAPGGAPSASRTSSTT